MIDYPFDQDRDNAGKHSAKRLKDRIGGDTSSFRTVIEKDIATGDETMLRTKGGMPEITRKPGKKEQVVGERTFVFKIAGATTAVVANKSGSGLARIGAPFLAGLASYFVAAWKKAAKIKWMDVIRLDNPDSLGDCDVILNHAAFMEQATTTETHSPSGIPYVRRVSGVYAAANPEVPTLSMLFIGKSSVSEKMVANVLKTGEIGPSASPTRSDLYKVSHSGNIRVKPDGTFMFYGGQVSYLDYDNRLFVATWLWSVIQTLDSTPHVFEVASGFDGRPVMESVDFNGTPGTAPISAVICAFPTGYTRNTGTITYFGPLPIAIANPLEPLSGSYRPGTCLHDEERYGQHTETVIDDYGYTGSDIQMRFSSTIDCNNYVHHNNNDIGVTFYAWYDFQDPYPGPEITPATLAGLKGGGFIVIDILTTVEFKLDFLTANLKPLFDVKWKYEATARGWPGEEVYSAVNDGVYGQPGFSPTWAQVAAMPANDAPQYSIAELTANTVDYVYADIDEDVFITLESSIFRHVNGAFDTWSYTAKYVVSVRGKEEVFPIKWTLPEPDFKRPYAKTTLIGVDGYPNPDGSSWLYPDIGVYHPGFLPTPIFNPAYMGQGNCPFIAYTTKAEESQGVAHEFYLDMPIYLQRLQSYMPETDSQRYSGLGVQFTPMQFLRGYYQYVQVEVDMVVMQNVNAWELYMFPTGRAPDKLQLCNGVKGPWADKLGSEFSGDPQMHISRI